LITKSQLLLWQKVSADVMIHLPAPHSLIGAMGLFVELVPEVMIEISIDQNGNLDLLSARQWDPIVREATLCTPACQGYWPRLPA